MVVIDNKIDQYRSLFSSMCDNTEKYKFLISLGRKAQSFPEEYRLENFKVHGCMSQVWLVPKLEDGKLYYYTDSDAAIVKGTVALVSDIYSDSTPKEIVEDDHNLMTELDLGNILSMNRRNGAYNMLNMIKEQAKIFL